MANRAERRRQQRAAAADTYQVPRGAVYDEFVGELRPPRNRAYTELHVRYGGKNGLYVDWSMTLMDRHGDAQEFYSSPSQPLERRKLKVVDVSDSAIRRHAYDRSRPDGPPQTTVLVELHAGDEARVDHEYMVTMNDKRPCAESGT